MNSPSLRSLPRVFVPLATADEPIDLPSTEVEKFRKVLRLEAGDHIVVLPNDGTAIRCEFRGRTAVPLSVEAINTEPQIAVTLIQALPKGDRLETVLRMGTEIGVSQFVVFPAIRSVVKWEPQKVDAKFKRLTAICMEAAEQSFRARIPTLHWSSSFDAVLKQFPNALVLSELESETKHLSNRLSEPDFHSEVQFIIGPEGGWDRKEVTQIGERGVSMGPRVFRTDTAGLVAASLALIVNHPKS